MKIYAQILRVFNEVSMDIPKDAVNSHFNYRYTSVDTLFLHIRKVMGKHGLFLTLNEIDFHLNRQEKYDRRAGSMVPYYLAVARFEAFFTNQDGESSKPEHITQVATIDKEQDTGKLQSYAAKYFLRRVFLLPLGEKDSDSNGQSLNPPPPQGQVMSPITELSMESQEANSLLVEISNLGFTDPQEIARWVIGDRQLQPKMRVELLKRWINLVRGLEVDDIADVINKTRSGGGSMVEVMKRLGLLKETKSEAVKEAEAVTDSEVEIEAEKDLQASTNPQTVPERRAFISSWMKSHGIESISDQKKFLSWITGKEGLTMSRCTHDLLVTLETYIETVPDGQDVKAAMELVHKQ